MKNKKKSIYLFVCSVLVVSLEIIKIDSDGDGFAYKITGTTKLTKMKDVLFQ